MTTEVRRMFRARGGHRVLFAARDREILCEAPAGTGKTRVILELLNLLALTYAGLQLLAVRKHAVTLTTTALATFNQEVVHQDSGVTFFGGSRDEPASYRYPNGSRIVVGGMGDGKDAVQKILSARYDVIYVNEATELSEDEWENLTARLRLPEVPAKRADGTAFVAQRIIGDCNPTYGTHWLYRRITSGKTRLIASRLEDNPTYYDDEGQPTAAGQRYIAGLDALTGTRYQRLRLGLRVGVENAIYPHFDRDIHIRPLEPGLTFRDGIWCTDWGSVHKAAVGAITVDQWGRRWIRAVWAEPDTEQGGMLVKNVGRLQRQFSLRRGMVGPDQTLLMGLLAGRVKNVSRADGPRQERIDQTSWLFGTFPGGRVPTWKEELKGGQANGPWQEDDSPGLLIEEGCEGSEELAEEIEAYHYDHVLTDRVEKDVVARINENMISAIEYGVQLSCQPHADFPAEGRREYATAARAPTRSWRSI